MYKVKKATAEMLNTARGIKRKPYPFLEMKVGEYFEVSTKEKNSIYNAIKHRRSYTKELEGWAFTIKKMNADKMAVLRIK